MNELPFRQIHMDFHTSPYIPDVGSSFNADEFVRTLKEAHVNSINLFSKCHHGMYYYPTKIGTIHPELTFDLLGEQVKACRKAGIRVCFYTTVIWNEDWCDRHPEWMLISPDGVLGLKKPFDSGYIAWRHLCLNNRELVAYLKTEFIETYALYKPDGYWIDIVNQQNCICKSCLADRRALGMSDNDPKDMAAHARMVEIRFMKEVYNFLKEMGPELGIYFNGHPNEMDQADDFGLSARRKRIYNSYIDMESLPSELWGYTHFAVEVNYLNKYDQELTMMNGKFHKAWGDFGSLRNMEALEYECFRALANGAKICVGDQLHPSGIIDQTVYQRIGDVFAKIENKEPWCRNTQKLAQIGVYHPNKVLGAANESFYAVNATCEGVYRMLSELHCLFDFLDFEDDITGYELVILTDDIRLPVTVANKLNAYVKAGGKLLLTAKAALCTDADVFALDGLGIVYRQEAEFCPRYMHITETFTGVPPMDYVMYEQGVSVNALPGSRVLAYTVNPYFNRTYNRFCSHRQTPPARITSEPCIIQNENIIYISNPLFKDYAMNGCRVYRDIIANCISRLLPKPIVRCVLPTTAELTLRRQGDALVLHVLNYIIQRKCRSIDTIEEIFPLRNQVISVRTKRKPIRVYTVPQMCDLEHSFNGEYAEIIIPEILGHQMVIID